MRKQQTSLTAFGIALARAIESEKPEDERICSDPYARQFVPCWMYRVFGPFVRSGYAEKRGPGVIGFLVARERYIDDVLAAGLEEGLRQVVILGAGFDSRAYRLNLEGRVKTFEVDHPATQQDKLMRLRVIFGHVPEHVTYVPIDFNAEGLGDALLKTGYGPAQKTLFIWQGVTEYLTPDAVDATLDFVARHSAAGSAVVFDYIFSAVLEGTQKHNEVSNMRRYRFMSGEGLTFGIAEGAVEPFLKARGFSAVTALSSDDLKMLYFIGKNADRRIAAGYGVATGVV
jgi:methyltransferase (TIGR00027 family)